MYQHLLDSWIDPKAWNEERRAWLTSETNDAFSDMVWNGVVPWVGYVRKEGTPRGEEVHAMILCDSGH